MGRFTFVLEADQIEDVIEAMRELNTVMNQDINNRLHGARVRPKRTNIQPSTHEMVINFNQQILGIESRPLALQEPDEFKLSLHQLREEIDEIEREWEKGSLVGVIDGLIDLDFFQKGVVYKTGISELLYNDCFELVFNANMEKKKGVKAGREGYNAADAVKPEGWTPPEERIFNRLECE